jgi:formate dehydrogenase iron-sulfur subunit
VGGTGVIYVLHDATQPELYGGLPRDPRIPIMVKLWKGPLKWIGNLAMVGGLIGLFIHYLRFGPKDREEQDVREEIAAEREKAAKAKEGEGPRERT